MIVFREIWPDMSAKAEASLTLPFQKRRLSRQRAFLDGGDEAALFLPRGTTLRDGAVLRSDDGRLVRVRAARECVSEIVSDDRLLLARAAYHLGNRHVPVQFGDGRLSYLHDHVLDDLVRGLGLVVTVTEAPFEPESGAYAPHERHAHGHSHDHAHPHRHDTSDDAERS